MLEKLIRIKNEHGVTLMELLAAIVIFTLFAGIIWGFLFQSLKFNDAEVTKQQLQQEANLIINTIQNVHIRKVQYDIKTNSTHTALIVDDLTFEKPGVKYEVIDFSRSTSKNVVEIEIKLSSITEPSITYIIKTTFNRIR